jgi:excisionase family DNA binding protein
MRNNKTTKDETQPQAPLLTIDEVCRFLKVSRRTVEHLIAAGELSAYKVTGKVGRTGGCTRVAQEDLDAYLSGKVM